MKNDILTSKRQSKGRPSKYTSAFCNQVIELMSKGYSKEAVAGELGISRDTFYQWSKDHKEFSDTIKRGSAQSALYWEKIGMEGMLGKITGFRPAVWIFIMKNRFGYRDSVAVIEEVEESKVMSREESAIRMRRIVEKYGKTLLLHTSSATNAG